MLTLAVVGVLNPRYQTFKSRFASFRYTSAFTTVFTLPVWRSPAVAARTRLYDASGVLQRHYTNLSVCTSNAHTGMNGSVLGSWQSGGGDVGCAWLEWYDGEDANHVSACQGWKTNRHAIGLPLQKVRKSLLSVPGGQYLPYPESGGWLEVTLYSGFRSWDYTGKGFVETSKELGEKLRWQLYKDLKVSVVNNDMLLSSLKVDDVEYSGRLRPSQRTSRQNASSL